MILLITLCTPFIVYFLFAAFRAFVKWDADEMWNVSRWSDGARAVYILLNIFCVFLLIMGTTA